MADAAPAGGATPRGGAGLFGGESRDYSLACSGHQVGIALFDLQGPGAENRPSLVLRRKPSLLLLVLKRAVGRGGAPRVVLMSATVDVGPLRAYFGGAAALDVPGRTFPVDVRYVEDAVGALANGHTGTSR